MITPSKSLKLENTIIKDNQKIRKISPKTFLKDYIYDEIKDLKKTKSRKKIKTSEFEIPKYSEYEKLIKLNFNVPQLRCISKKYGQRVSGNKPQLIFNLYNYLKYSYYSIKVQRKFRNHLIKRFIKLMGPAHNDRKCVNDTDFLTFKSLKKIPFYQFYSFKDKDEFVYGFDICSIYNMLCENSYIKNPYNRNDLPKNIVYNIKKIVKLGKILNLPLNIKIKNDMHDLSYKKKTELRAIQVFQNFDSMGFVTDSNWIMRLSRVRIVRYLRELEDVWNYRTQITPETKRNILPPNGVLFTGNINQLCSSKSDLYLKNYILDCIEKLTTKGINQEARSLGGFYALGTITIVSTSAANSLPWLYESFYTNH
tara:strand:- start:310 stop:1410 length:1101 start_codon:yes stop_codon:yes gene_type:complete